MDYSGKIVLVTGAARGIGFAVAEAYTRQGAFVIAADRDSEGAKKAALRIQEQGGKAAAYTIDLAQPAAIEAMFAFISETYGGLDVLINNAGYAVWKSPYDLEVEEWDALLHTNLRGTFCAQGKPLS